MELEAVTALWKQHQALRFPAGFRTRVIQGITLSTLPTDIGTCVYAAEQTGGMLATRLRETLAAARGHLESVLPGLDGEARTYFQSLLTVARSLEEYLQPADRP